MYSMLYNMYKFNNIIKINIYIMLLNFKLYILKKFTLIFTKNH